MQLSAETRADGGASARRAAAPVTARTFRLAAYGLAALTLGLWMVDIVRQLQLGVADFALSFYAVAGVAAVVVAVAVARQAGGGGGGGVFCGRGLVSPGR